MRCMLLCAHVAIACFAISTSTAVRAQTSIPLGISAPLTGQFAVFGHQIADGTKLAIDTINSQGGINGKRITAVLMDDGGQVNQAVRQAEEMIVRDKVTALIGYPFSPQALAVKQFAASAKVLMITLATAPELTADTSGSVLRVIGRADGLAAMVADYVAANFDNNSLGVQFSQPTVGFDAVLQRALNAKNINIKVSDIVPLQESRPPPWVRDVQTVITPLRSTVPGWIRDVARQSSEVHIVSPQVVISEEPSKVIEGLRNVTIISNPWPAFFPTAQSTIQRARSQGMDPNGYFLYGYAAVQVFASAAARANGHLSGPELFAAARSDSGVETAMGRLNFSEGGDLVGWRYAVLTAAGGPPDVCQLPAAQCRKYDSCPRDRPR